MPPAAASIAAAFLESVPDPAPFALVGDRLEHALRTRYDAAREAWPGIDVDPLTFARELARRLGDADLDALDACRTSDVYLAIACAAGDADATRTVMGLLQRELDFARHDTRATAAQCDDVRSELHHVLFADEPERPAALRSFRGRGDLRGYLKVMVTRALVRAVQRGRRGETPHEEQALFALLAPASDPELSILRARYHGHVESAMRTALARLDARSRAVLRYSLVDGWTVDQLGALYGVHRATAARWIQSAREQLGAIIRSEIAAELAVSLDEVDSIVNLVQSRIDVSFARVV